MITRIAICSALLLALSQASFAEDDVRPHAGMLRYPDVGESHIVFVYANDLWLAPRDGGQASPLASPPGREAYPRFSPDGSEIAFLGNYEGNPDLYVISARGGGIPRRVTHHPSTEVLCDWTPDGKELVFWTAGFSFDRRASQLFRVPATGGLPVELPVPYGAAAAISSDGAWMAYTPHNRDTATWKRYRGGDASDIWLYHLEDDVSKQMTDWEGTDTQPMWHGSDVYYLSDAGPAHRLNIWVYDTETEQRRQVTKFESYDVKWPSMGPGKSGQGEIVFENGGQLYLLDLASGESRTVEIRVPGDRPKVAARSVDTGENIQSWSISSTGQRAVIEARGEVWTIPAEHGLPRNLTRTSGAAERTPTWSPDGRWIAYFSDESGEYELYVTQSDGRGETRQLTSGSHTYYYQPRWSPDSQHIYFADKSGNMLLYSFETGEAEVFDRDPVAFGGTTVSWSPDSRWLTYALSEDVFRGSSIFLYDIESKERHRVTSEMFADSSPVFDRKGDWLYFTSTRSFENPIYGDLDQSFVYPGTQVLLAVPLREDIASPWLPEVDEVTWKDEKPEAEEKAEAADSEESEKKEEKDEPKATADDGLSGTWKGRAQIPVQIDPSGELDVVMVIRLGQDGSVSGSADLTIASVTITSGTFDRASGRLEAELEDPDGMEWEVQATVTGSEMSGRATMKLLGLGATFKLTRQEVAIAQSDETEDDEKKTAKKDVKPVEIDIEGFEARAIRLPVAPGNFASLAVNDKGALLYARRPFQGQQGTPPKIQIYDIHADQKSEKDVATGAGAFAISSDGKKILYVQGNRGAIQDAGAGSSPKSLNTSGLMATIEPREEWAQIFNEAWRLQRDFFYDASMHGVDWEKERIRYSKMLPDCADREDVGTVIAELISELNAGHAYYQGGDVEEGPSVDVGLLGCDFEIDSGAYRIARIHHGGPWDDDARGPLSQPGVDVKEGDYLLEINDRELRLDQDPWALLQGMAGKTVTLTVSAKPSLDDDARRVPVKALGDESGLRYRAWVERNRKTVEEKSDGRVGYVHVPDTGVNGQNNLVRQFYGQLGKQALIIDERWNAGGQIPTRFIEMLNRPRTNYWARRDGATLPWPPDSHQGPKCMLINGKSGSGGDAFPHYFRWSGIGKLIGRRTWGGLIGISGNPSLIDGAFLSVPTFGFYENDGTWAIEGHGVEPDIEVVDDPALMTGGKDPQLQAAIDLMIQELEKNPYVPVPKPKSPDRAGMGLPDEDH
ncbi:MAG: PDZ domain-containing protein [Planctomycetota bacterium]